MAGEVNYRGDNKDLRADLFPGYQSFLSEGNLKAVLEGVNLPKTAGNTDPITLSEMNEMAEQVYAWDVDRRAVERSAVSLSGVISITLSESPDGSGNGNIGISVTGPAGAKVSADVASFGEPSA